MPELSEPITAVVKWFDNVKGYGFLTDPATGQDYFVHQSDINVDDAAHGGIKKLKPMQMVHIHAFQHQPKGPKATRVVKLP